MTIYKTLSLSLTCISIIGLSSCATTPDPAKVCTAEWITPRADKAVSRIESKTVKAIKSLRKLGDAYVDGKTPGMFTMMRFQSSVESLQKELTEGRGITDIKMLAKTCDDPDIMTKAVRNVFENQGISIKFMDIIEDMKIYRDIIQKNLKDLDAVSQT
jgi:hypothetical protein